MSILDLWDQKDKTITLLEFCTILLPYILRFVHGAVAKKLKSCLFRWLGGQGACTLLFCEHYTNRACTKCLHPASSKAKKCEGNYECDGGYDVADVWFCEKCRKLSVMQGMCKSCNEVVTRTNMARPTYSNAHSLKWADAVANLGLSNRAAVILATLRLLFWHLAQPVLFAVLVFRYQKELYECCCFEGAAYCLPDWLWFILGKEMVYALTVMLCTYLFPVFLLMDVNASYDELKRGDEQPDSLRQALSRTDERETPVNALATVDDLLERLSELERKRRILELELPELERRHHYSERERKESLMHDVLKSKPQLRAWMFGYSVYVLCPEFVLFVLLFQRASETDWRFMVVMLLGLSGLNSVIFSFMAGMPGMIVSLSRYKMPLALYPTVLFTGLTALWCFVFFGMIIFLALIKVIKHPEIRKDKENVFGAVFFLGFFVYYVYLMISVMLCDDSVAGDLCYPNQTAAFNVTNTTFANATNVTGVR